VLVVEAQGVQHLVLEGAVPEGEAGMNGRKGSVSLSDRRRRGADIEWVVVEGKKATLDKQKLASLKGKRPFFLLSPNGGAEQFVASLTCLGN